MPVISRPSHAPLLLALTLLASAAVGCGGLPPVPSQGGPRWFALESEHFMLYTDQSAPEARATSAQLERQLDALLQLGFHAQGTLALKLDVIMLAERAQFAHFIGPSATLSRTQRTQPYAGQFVPQRLFEPLLIMSPENDGDRWRMLRHQLAHFLVQRAIGSVPPWLSEGLAAYFETAHFEPGGSFVVGRVSPRYMAWLHGIKRIPAASLLNMDEPGEQPNLYASAWLLVHYLMSEHSAEFAAFQAELASGKTPAESWQETLPELAPERLDALLDRYARLGNYLSFSRQIPDHPSTAKLRALSDADVYTLRAELYASCRDCGADGARAVLENLKLALRSEPGQLRATALLAQLEQQPSALAISNARASVQQHPEAWLAWLTLALAETDPRSAATSCDAELLPRLAALAPAQPYAVMASALCELRAQHGPSALALSARALALQAGDAELLLMRARVLRTLGQCTELAAVLTRARSIAHTPIAPERVRQLDGCQETPVPAQAPVVSQQ